MVDISKINTNNKVFNVQKDTKKQEEVKKETVNTSSNGVYPSGELLKSMVGIQSPDKERQDNQDEQISKYLHSLKITGQVMKAYEQDEEGKKVVQGLINTMKKNNVESSNAQLLIDLVESKKVHYLALLYFCNQSIMSDEYEKDLDLLYDTYINQRDVKEAFVPTLKDKENAFLCREVGDVFGIDGEDNIYIRTSENETKQLKITRDTYLKLFPPLERFALYQGDGGNCYMLSTIDAINSNPKTREKLLSCFEEKGDMLNVSLPNSDYVFSMNKNKMPDEIKKYKEQYSMGSPGFKIIEHVYGKDVHNSVLTEAHEILKDQSENAKGFFTKRMFKKQLKEFEKALAENPENIIIERNMSDQKVSWNDSIGVEWSKLDETTDRFKRASDYYRGRGGHEEWVMQRFGFDNIEKVFDLSTVNSEKMQEMLFNPENRDNYIFTACSHEGSTLEGLVDEDYGVYTRHSFSVKPKIDKDGNKVLHVSNPWNSTQSSVMSYEKFCEMYTFIVAAKVE